jgi:hypothetical protein
VPAGYAQWAPASWDGVPSERFTPLQQVLHVRDIEIEGYHVRFQRTLHETHPLLADIDSYALARNGAMRRSTEADRPHWRNSRCTHAHGGHAGGAASGDWPHGPILMDRTVTLRGLMLPCAATTTACCGLQWLLGQIEARRVAATTS